MSKKRLSEKDLLEGLTSHTLMNSRLQVKKIGGLIRKMIRRTAIF